MATSDDFARQLKQEIKSSGGRDEFLKSVRMSARTLSSVQSILDGTELAPWRASGDGAELSTRSQRNWVDIQSRLAERLRWKLQDVFDAFSFPERLRTEPPSFHLTIDQLHADADEEIKYAIVMQDEWIYEYYRQLVARIVKSVWPRWTVEKRKSMPAANTLNLLESRDRIEALHLAVGFCRTPRRETINVGFLPIPGLRWRLSLLAFEVIGAREKDGKDKKSDQSSPIEITWNGAFSGNSFDFHVLERDAGYDHVAGQKERPCHVITYRITDASADPGKVARKVALSLIDKAKETGYMRHAFVSDESTCKLVRNALEGTEGIRLLHFEPPKDVSLKNMSLDEQKPILDAGVPPSYEVCIGYKFDPKVRYWLQRSIEGLLQDCYQDMAELYANMFNRDDRSGLILDPAALRRFPLFSADLQLKSDYARDVFRAYDGS